MDLDGKSSDKKFLTFELSAMPTTLPTRLDLWEGTRLEPCMGRSGSLMDNFEEFSFEWQVNPKDPTLFKIALLLNSPMDAAACPLLPVPPAEDSVPIPLSSRIPVPMVEMESSFVSIAFSRRVILV